MADNTLNVNFKLTSLNVRGLNECKKRRAILRKLKLQQNDICLLQETHCSLPSEHICKNEWGGNVFFSNGTKQARGVMVLFKAGFDAVVKDVISDTMGRFLLLNVNIQNTNLKIINVYAPNEETSQVHFYGYLRNKINQHTSPEDSIIIGGDFNFIANPSLDRKGGAPIVNSANRLNILRQINSIVEDHNLQDIWRVKHPQSRRFTWHQHTKRIFSRLDYWYISTGLQYHSQSVDIIPMIRTDHSAIVFAMKSPNNPEKGKGLWKLNSSYLEEQPYVEGIINNKDIWLEEAHSLTEAREKWEYIKYKIRQFSIDYGKKKARERSKAEQELDKKLKATQTLLDKADKGSEEETQASVELNRIKAEMEVLDNYKVEGTILRSRTRWFGQEEKNNAYFLNLESRNKIRKTMNKLEREDGRMQTHKKY